MMDFFSTNVTQQVFLIIFLIRLLRDESSIKTRVPSRESTRGWIRRTLIRSVMASERTLCEILNISSAERVAAHYDGAKTHLINSNKILRRTSHEQDLYSKYCEAGELHGSTIYSSKGEHYTEVCPSLKSFIDKELKLDLKYFGYMEYAYGLEEHRNYLKKLIIRDHQLDDYQHLFEVGCFMNSTRLCMFDLGRFILQELKNNQEQRQAIVLSFEPGWDYHGVYSSLDMKVIHLPLTPENDFQPNLDQWKAFFKEQNVNHLDLVIINTQHNPTGKQWSEDVVNYLIDLSMEYQSYLLIDDAYYCVHDPTIPIVNTFQIWLKRLTNNPPSSMFNRWIETRPFGKQYNCNGMGVAAVSCSADLMSKLNLMYWDHNYLNGCLNAQMIYSWLNKYQNQADQFIIDNSLELIRKKNYVRQYMESKFDYPSKSICTGPSTSYLLFEVPQIYLEDQKKSQSEICEQFSDQLYFATGVMLSGKLFSHSNLCSYVRLHLGSDPANIEQIMKRFERAGLNYHMKQKFNSFPSKLQNIILSVVSN